MRTSVHGSSNCNAPDLGSAEQHKEIWGFRAVTLFSPFSYHWCYFCLEIGAGNCEGRAVVEEDPQTGLAAHSKSLAQCLALSLAVAVVGGEFEYLCLISRVYSEANNAAFVCGAVVNGMRWDFQRWQMVLGAVCKCWDGDPSEGPGLSCWAARPAWVFKLCQQNSEPEQSRDSPGHVTAWNWSLKILLSFILKFRDTNVSFQLAPALPDITRGEERNVHEN